MCPIYWSDMIGGPMAKSENQKQKLLFIAKYLMENTDENHAVSTPQLIEYLNSQCIKAERKSIYNDIDTLNDFGMDIIRSEEHRGGYMLASRPFELAEVKLKEMVGHTPFQVAAGITLGIVDALVVYNIFF